jgi:hypothetical protein
VGISTHTRKPPFSFFHPFYAVCCWGCDSTWFEYGITSLVVGHIGYSNCTGGVWSRVFRARLAVYLEYIPEEVGISTHTQVSVVFLPSPPFALSALGGPLSKAFYLFTRYLFSTSFCFYCAFSHVSVSVSVSFSLHCCIPPGRRRFLYYAQCSSSYDVSARYCGCARVRVEQYHIIQ